MINIFVSSTFSDMHAERDAIQMYVLPAIRKRAESVGESFDFCDLRWGINTLDVDEDKRIGTIVETCFREIKRCKPYMIVLLGERYGSCPDGNRLEEILSYMNADREQQFKIDEIKGKSYTDLEILYGPLSDEEQFRRTIFLFRNHIDGAPANFCGSQSDLDNIQKLRDKIKQRSKKAGIENIIEYPLTWDSTQKKLCGIDNLIDSLTAKLEELLSPVFERISALSPIDKILRRQWMVIDKKAKCFSAMDGLLEKSENILKENKELIICGDEGSGKSCLLSKLAQKKKLEGNVFPYDCEYGVTKEKICADWSMYLESILNNTPAVNLGEQPGRNLEELLRVYDKDDSLPPLYFFVDSTENIRHEEVGIWDFVITQQRYSKISFVYAHKIGKNVFGKKGLYVENSQADTAEILAGNMRAYGKYLPKEIVNGIVEKFGGCKPIIINLLFRRLSLLNATDFAQGTGIENQLKIYREILKTSQISEYGLFLDIISLLAERTYAKFINSVTGYLAASFSGLRRTDLQNLLKADGIEWDNACYSVLIDYLDEIFYEKSDGYVDFGHSDLKKCYVKDKSAELDEYRKKILDYLKSLPAEDSFRKGKIFKYCNYFKDTKYLVHLLQGEYNQCSRFVRSMGFDVGWLKDLFDNGEKYGIDIRAVNFINNVFSRNIIMGTKRLTYEIFSSALDYLDRWRGDKYEHEYKILKYHIENFEYVFNGTGEAAELSYIEELEGENFADTIDSFLIESRINNSPALTDKIKLFIKHSENRVGNVALAYLYCKFPCYSRQSAEKDAQDEKILDLFAKERNIRGIFTEYAINAIEDLCGNGINKGRISYKSAESFDRYKSLIANVAEAFSNRTMYNFYLDSCLNIAVFYIENDCREKAEKFLKILNDKIFYGHIFDTNSNSDLFNLSSLCYKVADAYKNTGNAYRAEQLYEYLIGAHLGYFIKDKIPKQLSMDMFTDLTNLTASGVICAEGYFRLAELHYSNTNYENCLIDLTNAIIIVNVYLNNGKDGYEAFETAVKVLKLFRKFIQEDIIPPDKILRLLGHAYEICCYGKSVQFFFCELPDFTYLFINSAKEAVKSCKRQNNFIAAIAVGKLFGIDSDV